MQRFEIDSDLRDDRQRHFEANVAAMCGWPLELLAGVRPFGARAASTRLGDVTVGEVSGAPHGVAYRGGAGSLDTCLINIPRRTRGSLAYGGRSEPLVVDRVYLLDDGAPWSLVEQTSFHHLVLHAPRSALPSLRGRPLQHCSLCVDAASTTLVAMMKSLVELPIDLERLPPDSRADIGAMLCSLLDAALRTDVEPKPAPRDSVGARERYHRQRIHDYALMHLADHTLGVESIAQAIGLSPRHVHRLYADEAMPLMRWVWAERLDRCRAELMAVDSHRSIGAIAEGWGFSSLAHFSRAFRQRFGISPRAGRNAGRAARSTRFIAPR